MEVRINLQPDPPILHAVQLTALIDHFLAQKSRRVQGKTVAGYRRKLVHFVAWWEAHGPRRRWRLDEDALFDFVEHLRAVRGQWGRPLSWNTRHDVLRRLRQVFRWAHQWGYITVDFAQFVPAVQGSARPRLPVDLSTLAALLDACDETSEPVRNRALIAVLAGTGIRCEECAALQISDIRIYADGSGLAVLSVAKNDKLRAVAFDAATGSLLRLWLQSLPYKSGPVFPSRKGRNDEPVPLSPSGLYKMLVRIAEIAGARAEVRGAHDFRRMFATSWYKTQPGMVRTLQKQMGHSQIETTMLYIQDDPTDMHEAIRNTPLTPMAQLSLLQNGDIFR